MTKTQSRRIWAEAMDAARAAARTRLAELQAQGPAWAAVQHENPLDDNSPIESVVGTMLDICGFAWLQFRQCNRKPTCTLIRNLKAQGVRISRDSYQGGYYASVPGLGRQELSVNLASAQAAAKVLQDHGVNVYAQSRVD